MKSYDPASIRNITLIGHGGSGKTTLASALLFLAGAASRLGKIEDGSTVTDYDADEIDKQMSLQLAAAHLEWAKHKVNILDTPGYPNFIFEAKVACRAADTALVMVEAVAGVQVQTERVWGFCTELKLPRMVVVSRMDRDNASPERALATAQEKLGREIIPIQLPIGREKGFQGVVDLIDMKALLSEKDGSGKVKSVDIPVDMRADAELARKALVEMVVELDDDLMTSYLETETLAPDDFIKGLVRGIRDGSLVPAVYTAGSLNVGTAALLDAVVRLVPSPEGREFRGKNPVDGLEVVRRGSVDEPLSAFVFKTLADPFTGKLSLVRFASGKMSSSDTLYNSTRDTTERFGGFLAMQGKATEPTDHAVAGDILVIAKLKETTTNDTICAKDKPIVFPPTEFPEPAMSFALEPKTRGDEDKLQSAVGRIIEEDPTVHYGRDPQTGEMLLSGMGEPHIEVVVGRLKKKFGVEVVLHTPKVPYRETIRGRADVQGRHKKQTGGRGQFADCRIRLEPMPRGGGFEFVDAIFGGSIPHNYRPAVEKGVIESAARGYLAGCPVVDFRVTLYDGSFHAVDSSEMAFKIAGSLAFKKAMEQAKPILLEPIMDVSVQAPDESMGDVIGQINTRRGRIQGMEAGTVMAQVPMAEMLTFSPLLKSLTAGRGTYHMEFSHYDEVPAAVAAKVIEAAKKPQVDSEE